MWLLCVDSAKVERELGGRRGPVAWTKGVGLRGGGGCRCSLEVRLTGLASGWVSCLAGRRQWSFAQGSCPAGQGHQGTEKGDQKIGGEQNKGSCLCRRYFHFPLFTP